MGSGHRLILVQNPSPIPSSHRVKFCLGIYPTHTQAHDWGQADLVLSHHHLGQDGSKDDLISCQGLAEGWSCDLIPPNERGRPCKGKFQLLKGMLEEGTYAPFPLITVVAQCNSWTIWLPPQRDSPRKANGRSFTVSLSSLINQSSQQTFLLCEIILGWPKSSLRFFVRVLIFLMGSAGLSLLKQKQHSRAHHLLRKLCVIPTSSSEVST